MLLRNKLKQIKQLWPLLAVNCCFLLQFILLISLVLWNILHSKSWGYQMSLLWGAILFCSVLAYVGSLLIIILIKNNASKRTQILKQHDFVMHDILEDFADTGYICYNEENKIIYMSKFVEKNFGKLMYGESISELAPDFRLQQRKNYKVSLRKNNKYYKLVFLLASRVILVKDTTGFERAAAMLNNNLGATIIFSFTNLAAALTLMGEQQKQDFLFEITAGTLNLSKKYKMFLVKPSENQFLVITNQANINQIIFNKELKRVLLDFNKALGDNKYAVQLSIGCAYGLNNLNILHKEALKNLHVCSQRGGNQAIITNCATTENFTITSDPAKGLSVEASNIPNFSHILKYKIKKAKNIIIMGHKNLDFDCLGAGLGLIELCRIYGKEAKILFDEKTISKEYKQIVHKQFSSKQLQETFINNNNIFNSLFYNSEQTLLLITDVSNHKLFENKPLFRSTKSFLVIDHHDMPIGDIKQVENYFVDSRSSSTCEMIIHLLNFELEQHHEVVTLPSKILTFLYMGMYIDTNDFKKQTTSATFTAAAALKKWGLDQTDINSIVQIDKTSFSRIVALKSIFEEPITGILICCDNDEANIYQKHEIAITCDELLMRQNSLLSVAIAYISKTEIGASLRSSSRKFNVQQIAEKLGGGGRRTAAAVLFKHSTPNNIKKKIISLIKNEKIIHASLI